MLLAVEVGLVDGEGVDELLDLAFRIAAQAREIGREGRESRRRHAVGDAAIARSSASPR